MSDILNHIEVYTDGSCLKNPGGPGAWAFVLTTPSGEVIEQSGPDPSTTNNKMEMIAALQALVYLRSFYEYGDVPKIVLYTDSEYVKKGMSEWMAGWKRRGWTNAKGDPIANQDIWRTLDEVSSGLLVDWRWVRGHAGHVMNERADHLATTTARTQRATYDAFHVSDEREVADSLPKRRSTILEIDAGMSDEVLAQAVRSALLEANGKVVRFRQSLEPIESDVEPSQFERRALSRHAG